MATATTTADSSVKGLRNLYWLSYPYIPQILGGAEEAEVRAFMKFVAEQKLENSKPCVVMINGGEAPTNYKDIFTEVKVNQSKIVSPK